MSRDNWRESRQTTHSVGPWPEPSVGRERVNRRRLWIHRCLYRLSPSGQVRLLPNVVLALLYGLGALHMALQGCHLASFLFLAGAAATLAVGRRSTSGTPPSLKDFRAQARSPFPYL
jgi:hypothetical protein